MRIEYWSSMGLSGMDELNWNPSSDLCHVCLVLSCFHCVFLRMHLDHGKKGKR